MSETDSRFTLPDTLWQRVEAAAQEAATTPAELIQAAVASYLDERTWQRRAERLVAYGRERAAAVGVTDEQLDDELHTFRRQRRAQAGHAP